MTGPLPSPAIPAIPHISGPKREFQLQPPPAATAPRPLSPLVWGEQDGEAVRGVGLSLKESASYPDLVGLRSKTSLVLLGIQEAAAFLD